MMRKRTMWDAGGDEHPYVEIGGIKWATMNIGAESETDYGLYFQWGDTQGYTAFQVGTSEYQKPFDITDYKFGNGTSAPDVPIKYNAIDGKTVLDLSDDAARLYWGGYWRMPTAGEFEALANATNASTLYSGGNLVGIILTDKTDSSKELIFPVGGVADRGSVASTSDCAYYTSSLLGVFAPICFTARVNNNEVVEREIWVRPSYGLNIRPVLDEPI